MTTAKPPAEVGARQAGEGPSRLPRAACCVFPVPRHLPYTWGCFQETPRPWGWPSSVLSREGEGWGPFSNPCRRRVRGLLCGPPASLAFESSLGSG